MANIESTTTSGAVASVFATLALDAGVQTYEIHWDAYTSEAECASGETVIVVSRDTGSPPVVKSTTPELFFNGYGGVPTVTAAISGDNVELSANGVALKDIKWHMRIES